MSIDDQLAEIKADKERLNALCDIAMAEVARIEEALDGVGVDVGVATRQGWLAYERFGRMGKFRFTLEGVPLQNCKRVERLLATEALPELVSLIQQTFQELLDRVTLPQQHSTDDQEQDRNRARALGYTQGDRPG